MTAEFVCTPCRLRKPSWHGCSDLACTCCYGKPEPEDAPPLLYGACGTCGAPRSMRVFCDGDGDTGMEIVQTCGHPMA